MKVESVITQFRMQRKVRLSAGTVPALIVGLFALCFLLIAVTPQKLLAQNGTVSSSLSGSVSDQTGAVVPGAMVQLTSAAKGITRKYTTDKAGHYSFNLLPPTTYAIEITAQGFSTYKGSGITLEVGQSATQDINISVGSTRQEVNVSADSPILQSDNANLSSEVSGEQVVELPLNLRNVFGLVLLNSSVSNTALASAQGYSAQADQNVSFLNFGGGFFGTTAYMLDGIWDTAGDWGEVIYVPSVDSVQEFRIQTNSFTAQYGWSSGNVVNVITKSGTNAFHGDGYEFYRNSVLDANNYFNNFAGIAKPAFDRSQFGVSAGGPLYIPHLYQQREKTFIFGLYEGLRQSTPATDISTVPTAAFQTGDFSALLGANEGTDALGRPIFSGQLYNPYTTRLLTAGQVDPITGTVATESGYIRDPFPRNNVGTAINPVGQKIASYYPAPSNSALINNFTASATAPATSNEYVIRVDHNISDATRVYGRWSQKYESITNSPAFWGANDPGGPGDVRPNNRYNLTLGANHVINPTTAVSITAGYNRWGEGGQTQDYGFNPANLGLPAFLNTNSPLFPIMNVQATSSLGPVNGNEGAAYRNVGSVSADVSKVIGGHSLSFGWMGVDTQNNSTFIPTTSFNFDLGFTSGPNPSASANNTGYGFASLLIGTPSGGSTTNNFNAATDKWYHGFYLQDDWKATRQLTVNLGIRYEFQEAPVERHDRQDYFDYNAPNPISTALGTTYPGEIVFNGAGNRRSLYNTNFKDIAPRVGFALQATPKLVFRGGVGLFFPEQWYGNGPASGFSQSTPFVSTVDGVTPYSTLSNPFPTGLRAPTGNSLGGLQDVGYSTTGIPSQFPAPKVLEFSLGLQYAFTAHDALKVSYVGNHGSHMSSSGYTHTELNPSYLSLGTALSDPVPNPFYGVITSSGCGLDQPTIPRGQALQPYPQYCSINESNAPDGFSLYDALQADYNHQFSGGLNLLVSYTFSKFLSNVEGANQWAYKGNQGVRNYYDLAAEKSVDASDQPQSLVVNYIYQLPVGKGKKLGHNLNTAANAALGGWEITGINRIHSGLPLAISGGGNSNLYGGGQRPDLIGNPSLAHPTINEWFNTAAFAPPAPFTFGDVPRFLASVRSPHFIGWDLGIDKDWKFDENKLRLQFRAEMFNAANHANFDVPDTGLNDGGFGTIRSAYDPRNVQFAGKVYW